MIAKFRSRQFPIWKFLNQRLFDPTAPVVLDPQRFWRMHQIQYLERCLNMRHRPEEHFRS
ncbi:hypothetical protein [Thermocoleostomius sinensis]|uniref:Uncharacterized protein n=1 Tax=Thermocoleostomius sinensis A174 TaxID=2016057 RepID=A0A9E8ZFF8_9CYAN|nr:hypothetical protein [Thermocoleostomius sinensis]WAL60854.1 hypothetical protein OXH18_02330 [Thermocoleostomius sinensis A174]